MFRTSIVHLEERSYAVCCNLVCLDMSCCSLLKRCAVCEEKESSSAAKDCILFGLSQQQDGSHKILVSCGSYRTGTEQK